jgi:hypothetical protein
MVPNAQHTLLQMAILATLLTAAGCLLPQSALAQTFELPIGVPDEETDPEPEPEPEPEEEDGPEWFNEELPNEGDSVIFVVDRSSSMDLPIDPYIGLDGNVVTDGTRLDYVKTELKRSVNSLSSSFSFNIVIYDECLQSWKRGRQQASQSNKIDAMAWIDGITPWGWTNTGGATALALADADNATVLVLSDGAPNFLDCAQSYFGDYETHRSLIRSSNQQAAVIHTFGIGLDAQTRDFLRRVAEDNGGTFREIQ